MPEDHTDILSGVYGSARLHADDDQNLTTVSFSGEIDAALKPAFDYVVDLAGDTSHALVIDLREASFMDSTGVSFLVQLSKTIAPARLTVANPIRQIQHLLEVTQVDQSVDIVRDR